MSDTTTATQSGITEAAPQPEAQPVAPQPAGLTQDQVNKIIADERRKWEKAAKEREAQAALEAQGEFKSLAEQRQTRIAELEAERQRDADALTQYRETMEQQIKARLRVLPEELRSMKPGDDPLQVFAWLPQAEALAAKLQNPGGGTPPGPRGTGAAPAAPTTGDLVAQKRASGGYSL